MTPEEFNKYMPRLGAYLYECETAECVSRETGTTVIVSERECMALACGFNAAHVAFCTTPSKPVEDMTDEDIERQAQAIFSMLADLYAVFGLGGSDAT